MMVNFNLLKHVGLLPDGGGVSGRGTSGLGTRQFTVVDGLRIARFWTRIHVRSLIFEVTQRVAKRWLRLASSDRDPHQRFAKNHAKSLLFFGLPNGALRSR
jgi:hypothetical protein